MDLVSPAEYARHARISKAAVSQQIRNGRIPAYGPAGERVEPGSPGKKASIPPIFAAEHRSIPSRTAASDRGRRLWLTFFDRRANARSASAE
jgi:hypothetical protein